MVRLSLKKLVLCLVITIRASSSFFSSFSSWLSCSCSCSSASSSFSSSSFRSPALAPFLCVFLLLLLLLLLLFLLLLCLLCLLLFHLHLLFLLFLLFFLPVPFPAISTIQAGSIIALIPSTEPVPAQRLRLFSPIALTFAQPNCVCVQMYRTWSFV